MGKSKKSKKKSKKKKKKCLDDEKIRVERDGDKYKIELEEKDAKCTDKDDRTYQYGQFKDVKTFSECAEMCVEDVRGEMLDSFRGIDFKCFDEECNCLYDRDALDDGGSSSRDRYDRTSRDQSGKGKVKDTKYDDGTFCGKLTSSSSFDFVEDEIEPAGEKSAEPPQVERFTRKGMCGLNMDEDDEDLCENIKSDYCGEGRTDAHFTMLNFCRYVGFDNFVLVGAVETGQAVSPEVADMYDMVVDDIEEELDDSDDSSEDSSEDSSSEDSSEDSSSEDSSESSEDSSEDFSSERSEYYVSQA